ncbi:hypothetical protein ACIPUC_14340 [Streptomyces sp. LARHCF249]
MFQERLQLFPAVVRVAEEFGALVLSPVSRLRGLPSAPAEPVTAATDGQSAG